MSFSEKRPWQIRKKCRYNSMVKALAIVPIVFVFNLHLIRAEKATSLDINQMEKKVEQPKHTEKAYTEDFKKGQRYFFAGKYKVAQKYLQKVLNAQPDHAATLSMIGDIYLLEQNYDLAQTYYRQAIEVSENPALEHYRLGQVSTALKDGSGAITNYSNAYRLDPQLKQSLFQLGYVYLVLERDKENTIINWQKFIDIATQDPQREKIEAILALLRDKEFKIPPKNSDISLAEALILGGKTVEASTTKSKDKEAGHEKAKTKNKTEGLLDDAEL